MAETKKQLNRAIIVAHRSIPSKARPPALTSLRWVLRLVGSYHLTHSTPKLLEKVAQLFEAENRTIWAQWARQKACEEQGHDHLALLDILAMGYDAETVVKVLSASEATALVNYSSQSIQDCDPLRYVGYSFVMEYLPTKIVGEDYIRKVEAILPLGICATRCLRVHSGVGADVKHVEETIEMVARLSEKERKRVALACYETALLCFSPPRKGYLSDEELQNLLKPLKLRPSL